MKYPASKEASTALQYFGRFYISQGMIKNRISTNDCGPTCVAMILNVIKEQEGLKVRRVTIKDVIQRIPPLGRMPGWIPKVGGASAPWGLAIAFNKLADENELPWQARRISHASQAQITEILQTGGFASFLRFWKNGGAHWTNIVAMPSGGNKLFLLDPNPFLKKRNRGERINIENFETIRADWERQPRWAACLGLKKEFIIYSKKTGSSQMFKST